MKENNLLASVALFSQLYNSEKYTSVSDILSEFIKGAVVNQKKWVLTSTELTYLLEVIYDFRIPEAVIRTTVKSRLKKVVTTKNGFYHFNPAIQSDFDKLNESYEIIREKQVRIIDELFKFIHAKDEVILEKDKKSVFESLNRYLLDSGTTEKYYQFISAFIIKNQHNQDFTESLNLIREGVILYQGIKYTADINELGRWNTELTIYLSTEHLFDALGYNGLLFQQVFNDFYGLVREINASTKNKHGENLIQLRFFEETRDQVLGFFYRAEQILKGKAALDTTKPAMRFILEGCKTPSDIKEKKILFDSDLKSKGILLKDFSQSIYRYTDFVVDDEPTIAELKRVSEERHREFDEELCRQFFRIFTKINYLRGGESKTSFERVGSLFLTGNRFGLSLARNSKVKFKDGDIPFAIDIDDITSKFWFKLKKGFSNEASLPKTFDVVTKAQIIIASQLNQSVFREYKKLQDKLRDGDLTREEAMQLSYDLREKPSKPEDVNFENIDDSLSFLFDDSYFEDMSREREKRDQLLKDTQTENEEYKKQILKFNSAQFEKEEQDKDSKRRSEISDYCQREWKSYRKYRNKNFVLFLVVVVVTCIPIVFGVILKSYEPWIQWMDSLGQNQLLIWLGLIIIFIIEWMGRSYIFDKSEIKDGWLWFKQNLTRNSISQIREEKFSYFESQCVSSDTELT